MQMDERTAEHDGMDECAAAAAPTFVSMIRRQYEDGWLLVRIEFGAAQSCPHGASVHQQVSALRQGSAPSSLLGHAIPSSETLSELGAHRIFLSLCRAWWPALCRAMPVAKEMRVVHRLHGDKRVCLSMSEEDGGEAGEGFCVSVVDGATGQIRSKSGMGWDMAASAWPYAIEVELRPAGMGLATRTRNTYFDSHVIGQ